MSDNENPPINPEVEEVGYCKPPKAWKWKKGESGNPAGKKKGTKSFKKLLNEALAMKVTVTGPGGKKKKTEIGELVVDAVFKAGIKGKASLAAETAKLLAQFLPPPIDDTAELGRVYQRDGEIFQTFWMTPEHAALLQSIAHLAPKRDSLGNIVPDENDEYFDEDDETN